MNNKFKKGDVVVWSGDEKDYLNYHNQYITLDKEYTIIDSSMISNFTDNNKTEIITIIDDTELMYEYNSKYFSTKVTYRNNIINEILS